MMVNDAKHRAMGSHTYDEVGTLTYDQVGNYTYDEMFTQMTNVATHSATLTNASKNNATLVNQGQS